MGVYRCGICEELKDGDYEGCFEHPSSNTECLCYNCMMECSCFRCGKESTSASTYCKITDQYYCEGCA